MRTVEFLSAEGANKDARNTNKQGAVHLAVSVATQNKVEMLKTLKKLKFDVNQQVSGMKCCVSSFSTELHMHLGKWTGNALLLILPSICLSTHAPTHPFVIYVFMYCLNSVQIKAVQTLAQLNFSYAVQIWIFNQKLLK